MQNIVQIIAELYPREMFMRTHFFDPGKNPNILQRIQHSDFSNFLQGMRQNYYIGRQQIMDKENHGDLDW